ncbi:efflux RND transporter periplasmic adaptor subunit [Neobacillus sp. OS1-32]|jgi:HlyD family secretion protein|uniref:Efflux RND transporter periplasmic adaptor subunit n=1 Tax=Neobacillus paridis TaxID=2803862 RepID=A0ABS1TRA8_9BACI|nr:MULTISPECIES: efflux RND transporter periplasmic adaptor subunit [Neobacillus]MBL4952440.1 efflux RND transporter periplasmic adaptor subunit [Neobacillus paridis]WML32033.1 efflux RND transporter periplasmic adaptor subunit [Neobacillus sp. OS1-32]
MKKKLWIGISVVSVIIIMIAISVYRQVFADGPAVKTVKLKQEEISSLLMIPGTVKLEEEQVIYPSPDKGEIKKLLIKEGQKVKKGTVLAELENPQLELEREQNKISIESAYLKIDRIEKQIDQLNDKEETLSKQVGKKEAKKQLKPEYDQLDMDKKLAELDLKQAEIQQDLLNKKQNDLELKSTMDGIVLTAEKTEPNSSQGSAAQPIIHIGKLEGMTVTGLLSEYDTLKVQKGQNVSLRSDAVPDKKWQGKITEISILPEKDQASTQGGSQAVQYPVKVKIDGDVSGLKPGFQLIMEIETEKKSAFVLPSDAVQDDGDQPFVFLIKDGKAQKQTVKTGIISGNKIEILSGVSKDDLVILSGSKKLKDGMEVTVK